MSLRQVLLPLLLPAFLATAQASPAMPGTAAGQPAAPCGIGTIVQIDASAGRLVIRHGEMQYLGMPAMTTAFKVRDRSMLQGLRAGERVGFRVVPSEDGMVVSALTSNE